MNSLRSEHQRLEAQVTGMTSDLLTQHTMSEQLAAEVQQLRLEFQQSRDTQELAMQCEQDKMRGNEVQIGAVKLQVEGLISGIQREKQRADRNEEQLSELQLKLHTMQEQQQTLHQKFHEQEKMVGNNARETQLLELQDGMTQLKEEIRLLQGRQLQAELAQSDEKLKQEKLFEQEKMRGNEVRELQNEVTRLQEALGKFGSAEVKLQNNCLEACILNIRCDIDQVLEDQGMTECDLDKLWTAITVINQQLQCTSRQCVSFVDKCKPFAEKLDMLLQGQRQTRKLSSNLENDTQGQRGSSLETTMAWTDVSTALSLCEADVSNTPEQGIGSLGTKKSSCVKAVEVRGIGRLGTKQSSRMKAAEVGGGDSKSAEYDNNQSWKVQSRKISTEQCTEQCEIRKEAVGRVFCQQNVDLVEQLAIELYTGVVDWTCQICFAPNKAITESCFNCRVVKRLVLGGYEPDIRYCRCEHARRYGKFYNTELKNWASLKRCPCPLVPTSRFPPCVWPDTLPPLEVFANSAPIQQLYSEHKILVGYDTSANSTSRKPGRSADPLGNYCL